MADIGGRTALVTGASSGIGTAIARDLASRGCHLVLTARRKDRLDALAAELRADHGVEAEVIALDLLDDGATALWEACRGKDISILVNNAGFGAYHRFEDSSLEQTLAMVQLNVVALLELTHRFVGQFRQRSERAYVLHVSSMVAWMPIPHFATYCGSKSFVRNFSETLAAELKGTNVSVTCLSPGGTATEFSDVAGQTLPKVAQKSLMSAQKCARIGVRAMLKRRRNVVPGVSNKFVIFLTRLFPRRAMGAVADSLMGDVAPAQEPTAALDSPRAGE